MARAAAKKKRGKPHSPTRLIVGSFLGVILGGTLLLLLPFSTPDGIGVLDALFTATSATCVTGLVVRDTYQGFTGFGQGVIICLIQIGGLGLVTLASFFALALRRRSGRCCCPPWKWLRRREKTRCCRSAGALPSAARF